MASERRYESSGIEGSYCKISVMNIQQLKYIVAIDRLRSFARAADACNISQPTLSAMLAKL